MKLKHGRSNYDLNIFLNVFKNNKNTHTKLYIYYKLPNIKFNSLPFFVFRLKKLLNAYPRTVMIKSINTIITQTAM